MIEGDVESKMMNEVKALVSSDCAVVGSWSPVSDGEVKGDEVKRDKKGVVSIYVQPRMHDDFSLPTVTLNGTIVLDARVEQCPTMAEVSEIFEKIMDLLDDLHYDVERFSETFSTEKFFATELRLDGGNRVSFNSQMNCWEVTESFTIRGTVFHNN